MSRLTGQGSGGDQHLAGGGIDAVGGFGDAAGIARLQSPRRSSAL
jgi:hypothetical protein